MEEEKCLANFDLHWNRIGTNSTYLDFVDSGALRDIKFVDFPIEQLELEVMEDRSVMRVVVCVAERNKG